MPNNKSSDVAKPASAMGNEPMSLDESFHNCFFYFMQAVDVLSLDAEKQCEAMGNFNVAWEIQHDVRDGAAALINWPIGYLSLTEQDAVSQIALFLGELPEAALLPDHMQAMSHPAWVDLRIAAKRLRVQLDDAVKKNREYFKKKMAQHK